MFLLYELIEKVSRIWGTCQLLGVLEPYTNWIRTFSCTGNCKNIGKLAHALNFKVALGAWLGKDLQINDDEINALIAAGKNGEADLLIVGSEAILRNDVSVSQLIIYINKVKQAVPNLQVTTADNYFVLLAHPDLMTACDIIFPNIYPFWEKVDINSANKFVEDKYQQLVIAAAGKEVIISETGWPSSGNANGAAEPTLANAVLYFSNFATWSRNNNVSVFYFEAFDEPWKSSQEGSQGAHWGLFNTNGSLKSGLEKGFN